MKHALLALCALALVAMLFVPTSASAQNAYNVNDKTISAGIGLGNVVGFYGTTTFPPIFRGIRDWAADRRAEEQVDDRRDHRVCRLLRGLELGQVELFVHLHRRQRQLSLPREEPEDRCLCRTRAGVYDREQLLHGVQPGYDGLQYNYSAGSRLLRLRHSRGSPVLLHPEICRSCGAWLGIRASSGSGFLQDLGLLRGTGRRSGGMVHKGRCPASPLFYT